MTISTGNVGFSVIGNAKYRKWVLIGQPIIEVELATKICNAGELILTKNTWQYVAPTKYEHVLVDSHNIKVSFLFFFDNNNNNHNII